MKTVTLLLLLTGYCLFFQVPALLCNRSKTVKLLFQKSDPRAIPMLSEEL